MNFFELIAAVISSSTLTALIAAFVNRKKVHADVMERNVKAALEIEERATLRYHTAQTALDTAEAALNALRREVRALEDYVDVLHDIMDRAGVAYPKQNEPVVG